MRETRDMMPGGQGAPKSDVEVGLEDLPAPPPEILFDQSEALPPPPPGGAADEAHLMSRMAGTTGATDWREEWNPRLSVSLATTKGLLNEPGDNNCFMNSAVQVLWHLDVFRRSFRLLSGHTCMGAHSCIFCALKVIFTQFQYSSQASLPPDSLRRALANSFADQQRFQMGLMDDAAECFENILTRIHSHLAHGSQEDACRARHCIPHQKFAMHLVEQVVCPCGAASEPHPFSQMVQYVATGALVAESRKTATSGPARFGSLLHGACAQGDVRDCPRNCGRACAMRRSLHNSPDVVSIGLIWDSAQPETAHLQEVVRAIGTDLHVSELFRSRTTPRLDLVGVVCYYGRHYSTFFYHSKQQHWIYFDDATVKEMGSSWQAVADKCCRGNYQPLLLLYANPDGTEIDVSTAPQKTTVLAETDFNSNHKIPPSLHRRHGSHDHTQTAPSKTAGQYYNYETSLRNHNNNAAQRTMTPGPEVSVDAHEARNAIFRRAITPGPDTAHARQPSYLNAVDSKDTVDGPVAMRTDMRRSLPGGDAAERTYTQHRQQPQVPAQFNRVAPSCSDRRPSLPADQRQSHYAVPQTAPRLQDRTAGYNWQQQAKPQQQAPPQQSASNEIQATSFESTDPRPLYGDFQGRSNCAAYPPQMHPSDGRLTSFPLPPSFSNKPIAGNNFIASSAAEIVQDLVRNKPQHDTAVEESAVLPPKQRPSKQPSRQSSMKETSSSDYEDWTLSNSGPFRRPVQLPDKNQQFAPPPSPKRHPRASAGAAELLRHDSVNRPSTIMRTDVVRRASTGHQLPQLDTSMDTPKLPGHDGVLTSENQYEVPDGSPDKTEPPKLPGFNGKLERRPSDRVSEDGSNGGFTSPADVEVHSTMDAGQLKRARSVEANMAELSTVTSQSGAPRGEKSRPHSARPFAYNNSKQTSNKTESRGSSLEQRAASAGPERPFQAWTIAPDSPEAGSYIKRDIVEDILAKQQKAINKQGSSKDTRAELKVEIPDNASINSNKDSGYRSGSSGGDRNSASSTNSSRSDQPSPTITAVRNMLRAQDLAHLPGPHNGYLRVDGSNGRLGAIHENLAQGAAKKTTDLSAVNSVAKDDTPQELLSKARRCLEEAGVMEVRGDQKGALRACEQAIGFYNNVQHHSTVTSEMRSRARLEHNKSLLIMRRLQRPPSRTADTERLSMASSSTGSHESTLESPARRGLLDELEHVVAAAPPSAPHARTGTGQWPTAGQPQICHSRNSSSDRTLEADSASTSRDVSPHAVEHDRREHGGLTQVEAYATLPRRKKAKDKQSAQRVPSDQYSIEPPREQQQQQQQQRTYGQPISVQTGTHSSSAQQPISDEMKVSPTGRINKQQIKQLLMRDMLARTGQQQTTAGDLDQLDQGAAQMRIHEQAGVSAWPQTAHHSRESSTSSSRTLVHSRQNSGASASQHSRQSSGYDVTAARSDRRRSETERWSHFVDPSSFPPPPPAHQLLASSSDYSQSHEHHKLPAAPHPVAPPPTQHCSRQQPQQGHPIRPPPPSYDRHHHRAPEQMPTNKTVDLKKSRSHGNLATANDDVPVAWQHPSLSVARYKHDTGSHYAVPTASHGGHKTTPRTHQLIQQFERQNGPGRGGSGDMAGAHEHREATKPSLLKRKEPPQGRKRSKSVTFAEDVAQLAELEDEKPGEPLDVEESGSQTSSSGSDPPEGAVLCNLCHKHHIMPPELFCSACTYYMAQFRPRHTATTAR